MQETCLGGGADLRRLFVCRLASFHECALMLCASLLLLFDTAVFGRSTGGANLAPIKHASRQRRLADQVTSTNQRGRNP